MIENDPPGLESNLMKIAFLVNQIETEHELYSTGHFAGEAAHRGHTVYYVQMDGFTHRDDQLDVTGLLLPNKDYPEGTDVIAELQRDDAHYDRFPIEELDVLMLRNDPAQDAEKRPWAANIGVLFGQEAARKKVIVLNDPSGLAKATNKLYLQAFPEEIRPRTLITRDVQRIREFVAEQKNGVVIKPLQGSGGHNVFAVEKDQLANLNQMAEAIAREGYIVAQEMIPAASEGDIRMFLMNGEPMEQDGVYAAIRRVHSGDDIRNNLSAGGSVEKYEIGETELRIAELVRPKLVQDGMFFVGLDIVGSKVLEVNVFSPGGTYAVRRTLGVDFAAPLIETIEHKVDSVRHYTTTFENTEVAIL